MAVLLLVTVWLPALLHCRLEAAGLKLESGCCEQKSAPKQDACADDSCDVAEGVFNTPASATFALSAPVQFRTLDSFDFDAIIPPEDLGLREEQRPRADVPPSIARTWIFSSRAALSPRAPSFVS